MGLGIRPGPITDVRPHQVDGFRQAWAAGQLPVVPDQPPALLAGRSAESLFWNSLARAGVGLVVHLVLVDLVWTRLPALPSAALIVGGGAAVLGYVLHGIRSTGRRNLEELAHGYTTFTMDFGDFFHGGRRFPNQHMPWDYSGAWHLHRRTGAVLAPPQRWLEPPGWYPSPNQPGSYELWTGNVWSGHVRPAPSYL